MRNLTQRFFCSLIATVVVLGCFVFPAFGQSRRLQVGQFIPGFIGRTVDEVDYKYKNSNKKVLLLTFLRADQKNSSSTAEDLLRIVGKLKCKPGDVDFVVVANKPQVKAYFKGGKGASGISPRIIVDSDFKIWGTFGIIACPTTIIGDSDGKVLCVKAGHSYDFAPVVQAYVKQALGIAQEITPENASEVKTLNNHTPKARAARNLNLARSISDKGKYETALPFAKRALELDPGFVDAKFLVGRLYCQLDDGKAALEVVKGVAVKKLADKAELALIKGWANRRLKHYALAEQFLLEAVKTNGKSPRIYYELGNYYRVIDKHDKASQAYRHALVLLLDKER
jgi:tetratricopeptide (TPR) repeat protein